MSHGVDEGIAFFYHPDFAGYDFGANHPFRGERFARFMESLEQRFPTVHARLDHRVPEAADDDLLLLAHTHSYLERVDSLEKRRGFLSLDTQVLPGSVAAARLVVGATVAGARTALEDGLAVGFGGLHHAGPSYGEGFCIFNDVAVAAASLLAGGTERIVILDTDAHHGNGTMDIFYTDPRVLFISLHQDPLTLYPGRGFVYEIGSKAGKGFTANIPMPVLAGGPLYETAMHEIVYPLIDEYEPQIIIRNGGSDPLYTDILTNLGLDLDSLTALTGEIAGYATQRKIPLLDVFLSGYGPYVTEGWLAIIRGLMDGEMELGLPERKKQISARERTYMQQAIRKTLDELKLLLKPFWKSFG